MFKPKCAVPGCDRAASVEAILYDVYPCDEGVFFESDSTCPYLCGPHMVENEMGAIGTREPRGWVRYPFTNRHGANGFTIYVPLPELLEVGDMADLIELLRDHLPDGNSAFVSAIERSLDETSRHN